MTCKRHSYKWVKDNPTSFTSHRECKVCGHDPVMAWYEKQLAKASKRGTKR